MSIPDEAGKTVPPCVGEFAVGERDQLLARVAELEAPMLEWAELDYTKHTRRSLMCYIGQQNFKITALEKRLAALKQPSAGVDERECFEVGINPHCRKRNEHGDYVVPEIQDRWDGWQARAQLAAPAGVPDGVKHKCSTCKDVGIIGRSDICPACADTWEPAAAPSPAPMAAPTNEQLMKLAGECLEMPGGCGMLYANYAREVLRRWASVTSPASDVVPVPRELQEIEWLEQWIEFAAEPIGQECCNRPGSECCGCPDICYRDGDDIISAMHARREELRALLNGGRV